MNTPNKHQDTITFLGTAGARFMVSRQLAASGGIWLDLSGTQILLDPGPGSIVQATKRKLDPEKLSAIILSHRHLDHSADANIMIEAMTNGGHNRHGRLFAPSDAIINEPVIFSYIKDFIEGVTILEPKHTYKAGNVTFTTSARHIHRVETYGMVFQSSGHTLAYLADTLYFENLHQSYNCEAVIFNVVLTEPRPPVDHLSIPDVECLIKEIKPRVAILSHFGLHVWESNPQRIAADLSERTGSKVIAAYDGMKFSLSELDGTQYGN
jgi:ribonuclease BN (tRNA processing enzyme)